MISLTGGLPAVLQGEDRPRDAAEGLAFARLCYDQGRHAAAARLWAEALAADPKLGDDRQSQHRYNAACAAALAGCRPGQGRPAARRRRPGQAADQALDWLRPSWPPGPAVLGSGTAEARPVVVRKTLQHWKADPDLAGVRDADGPGQAPRGRASLIRGAWAEVQHLHRQGE